VGVVETYVVRTGLGAAALLILIPPRGVPLDAAPRLFIRSLAVTTYFAIVIVAVQRGSPLVVQTIIAITPLLTLGYESVRDRTWPARRGLVGAALVAVGVAVVMVA
jgi:drug/metabolite transporter (DMT)-like permease